MKKSLLVVAVALLMGFVTEIVFPLSLHAEETFKIGAPTGLSGFSAQYGEQQKRTAEIFLSEINPKGGILGRKVEFIWEDTKGDPATAVRKARKLVEKDEVKFILAPPVSSEALAVSAMLPRWKVMLISSINGAGQLTGSKFNKYFFRPNTSAPMESKIVSLFIKDSPFKTFYGVGNDYAWPRSSIDAFEKLIKQMGKEWLGSVFAPHDQIDWSVYISKIKEVKPDALYVVLGGTSAPPFYKQAVEFGLKEETQLMLAILQIKDILGTGDSMEGLIGVSRYPFTVDNPTNKDFVETFYKRYNSYPHMFDGETYDALKFFHKAVAKAGTDDIDAIIKAWEDLEYEGLAGRYLMRACDHQALKPGFMVKAVKAEGYPHLIPQILQVYPGEQIVPPCRADTF